MSDSVGTRSLPMSLRTSFFAASKVWGFFNIRAVAHVRVMEVVSVPAMISV